MPLSTIQFVLQYEWQLVAAALFIYIATLCIYRRFFHPLADVPGPFLAAVTKLYQSAYNKQYYKQVERLHEKYGSPSLHMLLDPKSD